MSNEEHHFPMSMTTLNTQTIQLQMRIQFSSFPPPLLWTVYTCTLEAKMKSYKLGSAKVNLFWSAHTDPKVSKMSASPNLESLVLTPFCTNRRTQRWDTSLQEVHFNTCNVCISNIIAIGLVWLITLGIGTYIRTYIAMYHSLEQGKYVIWSSGFTPPTHVSRGVQWAINGLKQSVFNGS